MNGDNATCAALVAAVLAMRDRGWRGATVLLEGPMALTYAELEELRGRASPLEGLCIAVDRPPPQLFVPLALRPLKLVMPPHEHHARRVEVARRWSDLPVPPRSNRATWAWPLAADLALLGWRYVDGNHERREATRCESR